MIWPLSVLIISMMPDWGGPILYFCHARTHPREGPFNFGPAVSLQDQLLSHRPTCTGWRVSGIELGHGPRVETRNIRFIIIIRSDYAGNNGWWGGIDGGSASWNSTVP